MDEALKIYYKVLKLDKNNIDAILNIDTILTNKLVIE